MSTKTIENSFEDEMRESTARLVASGKARSDDPEINRRAVEMRENNPEKNREYWHYKSPDVERQLPIATAEEMPLHEGNVVGLIAAGETYQLPFRYVKPPSHEKELVCEMVFEDTSNHQNLGERLWKFVIPQREWKLFEQQAERAEDGTMWADIKAVRPYRISPRRNVVGAEVQ